MRAIWTGTIGFGLVNIPVKLYSATQQSELDLDMLDRKDLSNIRFRRVNERTGKEVAWSNIVRAYNYRGRYVVLTDEDFKKASPEKTRIMEIQQFIKEDEVDGIYYETPYYLEPQKSGEKAYVLLRDALRKSGKTGLATFVLRTRENLGLIRPSGKALLFQKIRYAEEIRDTEDLKIPAGNSKPAELKMAISLINQLSAKFSITKYKDSYSADLMKLIAARAKGRRLTVPAMKVVHSPSRDLMEQLKASLGSGKRRAS